jgi:hypothetical protein
VNRAAHGAPFLANERVRLSVFLRADVIDEVLQFGQPRAGT